MLECRHERDVAAWGGGERRGYFCGLFGLDAWMLVASCMHASHVWRWLSRCSSGWAGRLDAFNLSVHPPVTGVRGLCSSATGFEASG